MDRGFDHSKPLVKWFDTVQRPDARPATCCGLADAYEGDVYVNRGDHYDVTITDGSEITYPDGTHRLPIANGTVVNVPIAKVTQPKDGNPTGHGVLFITVQDGKPLGTYCFVPMLPGS
jgi:predicted RNA-binding protein with TRAM domain